MPLVHLAVLFEQLLYFIPMVHILHLLCLELVHDLLDLSPTDHLALHQLPLQGEYFLVQLLHHRMAPHVLSAETLCPALLVRLFLLFM